MLNGKSGYKVKFDKVMISSTLLLHVFIEGLKRL
jgi:hypothetical protein